MRLDASGLLNGLTNFENKTDMAIRAFCEQGALKMQGYAKQNARWVDRTGRARTGLNAGVEKQVNGYRIRLAHGVDYGIFLELKYNRLYSIIPETINYVGTNQIMPSFERLLERLSG